MLHIKSNPMTSAVCCLLLSMSLAPAVTQAETAVLLAEAETGSIAARQAAEQKEALAKKAAERAAKKAAEAQKPAEPAEPGADNAAIPPVDESKQH